MNWALWETLESEKNNGISAIATFCEYQIALVAVGKTTEWVQLALFVNIKSRLYLCGKWGNMRNLCFLWISDCVCSRGKWENNYENVARFCEYQIAHVAVGKTRKRLEIVHFTTIIALVAVGKQGKEQIVGLHREGKQWNVWNCCQLRIKTGLWLWRSRRNMHNYYFSQIITTLVPVGKARETKVSYVEINCRRRRKILHIFGPSALLAWRNHQQFPRSFSIRSGAERKKLAAYFFLRGQQFSAEPPPPHPPLGTQVPPKRDRKEIELSDVLWIKISFLGSCFRKTGTKKGSISV